MFLEKIQKKKIFLILKEIVSGVNGGGHDQSDPMAILAAGAG